MNLTKRKSAEAQLISSGIEKIRFVQVKNPKTGKYVKIDRLKGNIISHKKSEGPYKGIRIVGKKK